MLGSETVCNRDNESGDGEGEAAAELVVEQRRRAEEDEPAAVEEEKYGELTVVGGGVGEIEAEVCVGGGVEGDVLDQNLFLGLSLMVDASEGW